MDAVLYLLEVEVRIYSLIRSVVLPATLPATQAISLIVYSFFDGFYFTIDREVEQDAQVIIQLNLAELRSLIYFFLYLVHLR